MDQSTVVYVSFGSLARMPPKQLYEVGHGLEDSRRPFLWVVKESETASPEAQVAPSPRGAHGRAEARSAWLGAAARHPVAPRRRWLRDPLRVELAAGVRRAWRACRDVASVRRPVPQRAACCRRTWDQRARDAVGRQQGRGPCSAGHIARAVSELMGGGAAAEERRRKCNVYGERAHGAMAKGGSSHENLTLLLHSFMRTGSKEQ
ncbi:hypothetical protein ZWY2020_016279 [Hordeum vulgare]|nr:hypothetical protein ZWY2020_016279 [Hordeum vulgare]